MDVRMTIMKKTKKQMHKKQDCDFFPTKKMHEKQNLPFYVFKFCLSGVLARCCIFTIAI